MAMSDAHPCSHWEPEPGARFCGECGTCIVPIELHFDASGDTGDLSVTLASEKPDCDLEGLSLVIFDELSRTRMVDLSLDWCAFSRQSSSGDLAKYLSTIEFSGEKIGASAPAVLRGGLVASGSASDALPRQPLPGLFPIHPPEVTLKLDRSVINWYPQDGTVRLGVRLSKGAFAVVRQASLTVRRRAGDDPSTGTAISLGSSLERSARLLLQGDTLVFTFEFGPAVSAQIQRQPGLLDAKLDVSFAHPPPGPAFESINADFARAGPERALLLLPNRPVDALAGRRARVGIVLRNEGGTPFDYTMLSWRLIDKDGKTVLFGEGQTRHIRTPPDTLAPGDSLSGELCPLLKGEDGKPIEARDYRLECDVWIRGEAARKISGFVELRVLRGDRVFDGIVCVDFGTTETAVSIKPADASAKPKVLSLDRVDIEATEERFEGERLIPTVACAIYRPTKGLEWKYGRDAMFGEGEVLLAGKAHIFNSLKWRLTDAKPVRMPDDSQAQWIDIVSGYLEHVLDLAETHPDICGCIRSAYVTKPAVFSNAQVERLVAAFNRHRRDFVQTLSSGSGGQVLISESWSPLYATLPAGEDLAELVFRNTLDGWTVYNEGVSLVVTFDVGGGSCDVSAFRTSDAKDQEKLAVEELFKWTSTEFCGERFGEAIDKEVEASLCQKLGGGDGASTLAAFGFEIQKPDAVAAGPIALANRQELRRVRMIFQHHSGVMEGLIDLIMRSKVFDQTDPLANIPDLGAAITDGWNQLEEGLKSGKEKKAAATQTSIPIRVRLAKSGEKLSPIDLESGDVKALAERIVRQFLSAHRDNLRAIMEKLTKLVEKMQGISKDRAAILITGRGANYPLASGLLRGLAERGLKDVDLEFQKVAWAVGEPAKWVTSIGGVLIGDDIAGGEAIDFMADIRSSLRAVLSRRTRGKRAAGPEVKEETFETSDSPEALGIAVMAMGKLRERLSNPHGYVEVVRCFDDGRRESLGRIQRSQLAFVDFEQGWLCVEPDAEGGINVSVARADTVDDALAFAVGEKRSAA